MKRFDPVLVAVLAIFSGYLLAAVHYLGDPEWLTSHLRPANGSDGVLWQVQTTFLSVGFAGLAIAAQLFAESPLAIGASRGRVLEYIRADWFVGVGLATNALLAIETVWLSSGLGVLGVSFFWFVPTVVLLVVSMVKLIGLFGNPSLIDEMVRASLVESLSSRLTSTARKYSEAAKQLDGLVASSWSLADLRSSTVTLRVPVPQVGVVIKAIKPNAVRQVFDLLAPRVPEGHSVEGETLEVDTRPRISMGSELGDRTRLGDTAFRVITRETLDAPVQDRIIRLLQSSIEFEDSGAVTAVEEMDREIASLKDAVGTSIRSGAFAAAERAVELLGHVIRGGWMTQLDGIDLSRRASFARRDWLFGSIGDVEQDAVLSARAAGMFVGQAMTRALEAPHTGSSEYVDECLRSFTRIWLDILRHGGTEFDHLPSRIVVCVQNLAEFAAPDQHEDLSTRATWAMVELVKLALDAHKPEAAVLAAEELGGLFEYSDRNGTGKTHVRAGQLVLAGWLEYLADKGDDRCPVDAKLRTLVTPNGNWAEILAARDLAERGEVPFSRWDWWETKFSGSSRAQLLELSHYIDRAQLAALAMSYGPIPPVRDQQTASEYRRLVQLLGERDDDLSAAESALKQTFVDEIAAWKTSEDVRLAAAPLSDARITALRTALKETLDTRQRLADAIPRVSAVAGDVDASRPILGMNFLVPRQYFVDEIFNETYTDPTELGRMIARGLTDGEERKIVGLLRSVEPERVDPSVQAIGEHIEVLGQDAEHYVLLAPHGGLGGLNAWYSPEFSELLARVIHIPTSMLDEEVILFDRRTTLTSCRGPEAKKGLAAVGDTSIALGVFEDLYDGDEPKVRLEVGEYFVAWPGEAPRVIHFGSDPEAHGGTDT